MSNFTLIIGAILNMALSLTCLSTVVIGDEGRNAVLAKKILFVSNRVGLQRVGIYSMNPDGSRQARLSSPDALYEFDPALSPNGRAIAFVTDNPESEEDYATSIHLMRLDGSGRKRLTTKPEMACAPAWSPDGKTIAFCDFNIWTGKRAVYLIDADGQNRRQLAEGIFPFWSPDGKRLAYSEERPGVGNVIVISDLEGAQKMMLVEDAFMGNWSPDGKQITYTSTYRREGQTSDLFVVGADGMGKTQLTTSSEAEVGAHWSADGKRIYFARVPNGGDLRDRGNKAELFVINSDGEGEQQLTNNAHFDFFKGGSLNFLLSHPADERERKAGERKAARKQAGEP